MSDLQVDLVQTTAEKLMRNEAKKEVIVGFDGFIDEIIHIVSEKIDAYNYKKIETIADYGERIKSIAGLSGNYEMRVVQTKLGGNGPIMANALTKQGYDVNYIGALGATNGTHPIFEEFISSCVNVISIADPANTEALEFNDGKIMMGRLQPLEEVNWENLIKSIDESLLIEMMNKVSMIACVNWTMLPFMNSIYKGLYHILEKANKRIGFFVDLTDPKKRSRDDMIEMTGILKLLQTRADVILGLNKGESMQIREVLNLGACDDLQKSAKEIRENLNLHQVVIHGTKTAAVDSDEGTYIINGPYTPKPKITTGAGDNFNAGYCNGWLAGLNPEECLATGVCSSGFYVRNAQSSTKEDLVGFMKYWSSNDCKEI